jgi:biopolymer transport protein ExbB
MLSQVFLQISLVGAESVLLALVAISILSVSLMLERARFYRKSAAKLGEFRSSVQALVREGRWDDAIGLSTLRAKAYQGRPTDLETGMTLALLRKRAASSSPDVEVLAEVAQCEVVRAKIAWDRSLSLLATIGANAPFVGLFGTVLGIIKAFHDLAKQTGAGAGAQTVSSGISEALIATAVGILVAIPAVVAFNVFQRKVRVAMAEAESLKCFLLGEIAGQVSHSGPSMLAAHTGRE